MTAASLSTFSRDGDMAAVRVALSAGADPNQKYKGQTPLMYAAEKGRAAVIELLIANGAKVDVTDSYNRTALHFATMRADIECCKLLLARGASVDVQSTLGGESPLDITKMRTLSELHKILLQARDGVPSPVKLPALPGAGARINIFAGPVVLKAHDDNDDDGPVVAEEALPVAMSMPRRAPPAELDELRRMAPAPRALE